MTTAAPVVIEQWRFALTEDGADPEIVGLIDGIEARSGPIAQRVGPDRYTVRDGTIYRLGVSDPTIAAPYEIPRGSMSARLRAAQIDIEAYRGGLGPTLAELAVAPTLVGWVITADRFPVLIGSVTSHPRIPDGPMTTSAVLWLAPDLGAARTLSRLYRLGRRALLTTFEDSG